MQYKEFQSFNISTCNGLIEAQISPNEKFVAYVDKKKLNFYNLLNQEMKTKFFNNRISILEFSIDSQYLYVGLNNTVISYNTRNLFIQVCSFQHNCDSYAIQRSNLILYKFDNIKIINLRTKKLVTRLECKKEILCTAVSKNIIAVLMFGQIRIYQLYCTTIQAEFNSLKYLVDQIQIIDNQVLHIDGGGCLICWHIDFKQKILTRQWIISSKDQCVNFCYSITDKFYCLMYRKQLKFYSYLQNSINIQILNDRELKVDQCRVKQGQTLKYILLLESSVLSIFQRSEQQSD